ncbi:MAG: ubiquinone-binding protein [Rickettsiales bacterium]|nr:ubiquinone-binding protein [Rickettsiales bacterium]|tara:strand:+ start:302 stop:763 length:462 start_codon:yes stop_codon:yes gene_type:complete
MPAHKDTQHSPYQVTQLYHMVADVERYPEFLPWCRAARILKRGNDYFDAELVICFKHMCETYASRVHLTPQATPDDSAEIKVELLRGPFKHLNNYWKFTPQKDGGTEIHFEVDFAFKSRILDALIGTLFDRATMKMVNAFSERADVLYGDGAE